MPDESQLRAFAGFVDAVDAKLIVVGEDDDTDWCISGPLDSRFVKGDVEGRARIVGKVSRIMRPGQSKPFVTFPGMNVLSRRDRRALDRKPIPEGKEDEYLHGPALVLDVLAIYR